MAPIIKKRADARSQGDNIYRPPEGLNAIEPQPLNPYLPDKVLGPLLIAIVGITELGSLFGDGGLLSPIGPQGTLIPGDIPPNPPPQIPPKDPGSGSGGSSGGSTGGSSGGSTGSSTGGGSGAGTTMLYTQHYIINGSYSSQVNRQSLGGTAYNGLWESASSSTTSTAQVIDNEFGGKDLSIITNSSNTSFSLDPRSYSPGQVNTSTTNISYIVKNISSNIIYYMGFLGGAPLYTNVKPYKTNGEVIYPAYVHIASYGTYGFTDYQGKVSVLSLRGSRAGISQWIGACIALNNQSFSRDYLNADDTGFFRVTGYDSVSLSPILVYEEPAGKFERPGSGFGGGGGSPPPSKKCEGDCMGCDCTTTADLFAQLIFQQQKREDDLKEFIQRTALEQLEITKKMLGNIELSADYQPIIDRIAKAESTLWNGVK